MDTGLAGRRTASQQNTEALDRSGPHFGTQRPVERPSTVRLVETSRRVPAQPRTASRARADHQFPVRPE